MPAAARVLAQEQEPALEQVLVPERAPVRARVRARVPAYRKPDSMIRLHHRNLLGRRPAQWLSAIQRA